MRKLYLGTKIVFELFDNSRKLFGCPEMDDLSDIRKGIISILNMYPKGIAQDDLKKDYKGIIGGDIPFKKFGYASIKSFLESELPENVRIVDSAFNTMYYLVKTARSGHIANAVEETARLNNRQPQCNRQRYFL